MSTYTEFPTSKTQVENPTLAKNLKRHVCSLIVLAYRYQMHLPHLLSPGLSDHRDHFLSFGQELRSDIALLTGRIQELGETSVSSVEEIEERSYLPLLLGGRFGLNEIFEYQRKAEHRLGKALGHTVRLAKRMNDSVTAGVMTEVLAKSEEREKILSSMGV